MAHIAVHDTKEDRQCGQDKDGWYYLIMRWDAVKLSQKVSLVKGW